MRLINSKTNVDIAITVIITTVAGCSTAVAMKDVFLGRSVNSRFIEYMT